MQVTVKGLVGRRLQLSMPDLLALPQVTITATLQSQRQQAQGAQRCQDDKGCVGDAGSCRALPCISCTLVSILIKA